MTAHTRKKILCAWELGGDLGHLTRLAALAQELQARGWDVTIAAKDLSRSHSLFAHLAVRMLQAPVWLPKVTMQRPIACLPDTLLLNGYLEPDPLHALVSAWQNLLDLVQPDLLICDYSPTALLANHGSGRPVIVLGTSFAEPVPQRPVADWRPWPASDGLIARQEQRVLESINQVLQRQQKPAIKLLADLYDVDTTFITTFPEFDLYPNRPKALYGITRTPHGAREPVVWPAHDGPRIIAYLKPQYPQLPQLVEALARCNASVFVACPHGNPATFQPHVSSSFAFSTQLVELESAMQQADLFVGHGNMGSVAQSLLAGKPVVALPVYLEQLLTGKKLQELGLGTLVEKIDSVSHLQALLEQRLADTACRKKVEAFAQRCQPLREKSLDALIADRCAAILSD